MKRKPFGLCMLSGLLLTGPAAAQTMFTEVAELAVHARGTAIGDFDNDGWPDMFRSEEAGRDELKGRKRIALLHNEGGGRFVDLAPDLIRAEEIPDKTKGGGPIFGDYDNDGDLDIFVPVGTFWADQSSVNVLLRNDRGSFHNVALEAGLLDTSSSDDAIWLDYDRDGHLDLLVGNAFSPRSVILYHNEGNGRFSDVTREVGLGSIPANTAIYGLIAGDFNGDGWPDLYLGAWTTGNQLFLNDTEGRFTNATTGEIADLGTSFGARAGDIDDDGDLDIFQAVISQDALFGLYRSVMLLNLGEGKFLDVTEGVGLAEFRVRQTVGPALVDTDNDGDLDLMIAEPPALYVNDGNGFFAKLDSTALGVPQAWTTSTFGDFDLDGFLDVCFGGWDLGVPGRLYRNRGNANNSLRIELVGVKSNRNGIGARLTVMAGDLQQVKEIFGGWGIDQEEMVAHFGLGQETKVDRLEVRWPLGQMEVLTDIPADQKIRVIEGSGRYYHVEPTRWQQAPPETLVAGTTLHLNLAVQPALFDQDARITGVTADLSALGGSAETALAAEDDGTYHLRDFPLPITGTNGIHFLHVMIDQTTSLGPHWVQLSRSVAVLPAEDLVVFGDALNGQWQVKALGEVAFDFGAQGAVFSGPSSLGLRTSAFWKVDYLPAEPVERVGYQVLRFAFHPGEATVPRASNFTVLINSEPVILLGRRNLAGIGIDLEVKDWQVVEIPLDSLKKGEPITSLRFQGNLEGTFYLDDIRLVTAASQLLVTVVEEERSTALPQAFSLSQNFPNPFNSDTVIRFALPEDGQVELAVYNIAGQQVAALVQGAREAGSYTLRWDGRDGRGKELASGIYLYRLRAGEKVETRRLALLK